MLEIRLKELRAKNGLSQKALAEMLHVSQQTVGKWETEGATPNPDMLSRIADIFEVTVDYLIGHSDSEYDDTALKFALFGGDVDDEILEEVKRFAKYARDRKN
ncbi:MAG: helix-turn-helix transcriptional regulator [Clostridia bacterium]|nr:helix-turn-helix transcriptional regulator [Clostridia bacterium]